MNQIRRSDEAPARAAAFTIGQAARAAAISVKMARHYDALGLVPGVVRDATGLRRFDAKAVHTLNFIGRGRSLGFSLRAIAQMLSLWQDTSRSNAEVKRLAEAEASVLRRKRDQLAGMLRTVDHLISACAGDGRPDCPILEELGDTRPPRRKLP